MSDFKKTHFRPNGDVIVASEQQIRVAFADAPTSSPSRPQQFDWRLKSNQVSQMQNDPVLTAVFFFFAHFQAEWEETWKES